MPNSHQQKTDILTYPIYTRIFEDFLGLHDFVIEVTPEFTIFKKGELKVEVPHLKKLSKFNVTKLLKDADLPISTFEEYYKSLKGMATFNQLIDLSIGTLKK